MAQNEAGFFVTRFLWHLRCKLFDSALLRQRCWFGWKDQRDWWLFFFWAMESRVVALAYPIGITWSNGLHGCGFPVVSQTWSRASRGDRLQDQFHDLSQIWGWMLHIYQSLRPIPRPHGLLTGPKYQICSTRFVWRVDACEKARGVWLSNQRFRQFNARM